MLRGTITMHVRRHPGTQQFCGSSLRCQGLNLSGFGQFTSVKHESMKDVGSACSQRAHIGNGCPTRVRPDKSDHEGSRM